MMTGRARLGLVLVGTAVVWLGGCSAGGAGDRVVVRGKLVDGGRPFVLDPAKLQLPKGATALPPGSRPLQVTFISAEGGEQYPAVVKPEDGTFTVPGTDGKGIKPGRYKVAIAASAGAGAADYFGGKYAADKTQVSREVKPGDEVVIDVSKPQG